MQALEEAKRRLPLPQLMANVGDGDRAKRSARCPFHEDATNSFSVFAVEHGVWLWKCHAGCGAGDGVTYLAKRFGLSMSEAIRRYLQEAGVKNGETEHTVARSLGQEPMAPSWSSCVAAVGEIELRTLSEWRGYSPEFCGWLRAENAIGLYDRRWALPVHTQAGAVIGCHYRVERGDGKKADWYYYPKGLKICSLVFGDPKRASDVWVFESPWDALAVMDKLGWHVPKRPAEVAVVSTRGAGNAKLLTGALAPSATVHCFPQNDAAGQKWLAEITARAGCKVLRVLTPADFKDPNDWTKAGATKKDLEAAMHAAQAVGASQRDPAVRLNDPRPKVLLPGDNRLLSDFGRDVGQHLGKTDLFRRDTYAVIVNSRRDGLEVMTPDLFRTWAEQHLICCRIRPQRENVVEVGRTMNQEDANAVLRSAQFLQQLRPIERLNAVRLPVVRADAKVELLPEGYDVAARVYTSNEVAYAEDMPLAEAKAVLDDLLGEFPFADAGRSKAVALAAQLTLYAYGLLPPKSLRPVFVAVANDVGAGKTLVLKCGLLSVCGHARLKSEPKDDDEIRKSLLTAVMEARPYVFFDNVKGRLTSASLEAFATATAWEDRILGKSRTFAGDNCSTVFISGNSLTVSPDLARRGLFVELFQEHERPEDRKFKRELDDHTLLALRPKTLAALWALVREWQAAGRPVPSRTSSSFPAWSRIVGGIVEHAGYGCALETPTLETGGDRAAADMHKLICAAVAGREYSFQDLVGLAQSQSLFDWLLPPSDGPELDPKHRSIFGNLLRRYDRRLFGQGDLKVRLRVVGTGHNRRFKIVPE